MKTKRKLAIMLAFVLMVSLFSGINFERAKADVLDTASTLSLNGIWTSEQWLTETIEERYYKIVIPSDGNFELKVMSYITKYTGGGPKGARYELYDKDLSKTFIADDIYGTETSPTTKTVTKVFSAGVYYLKVQSADKSTGKFKLCATHTSYGVNDQDAISYGSPQNYSLGTQITGALTESDAEDWYKLTISSSVRYIINLQSYTTKYTGGGPKGVSYELYNQDLSKSLVSDQVMGTEASPTAKKSDVALEKGTYYLKIWGSGAQCTGKYSFSVEKLTQSNCNHAYESKQVYSTYAAKGYILHKCPKCGHSYKDSYTAKKVLNRGTISAGGLSPGKKSIKVFFYSIPNASGYQIRYSTDKKLKKSVKTVKAGKNANSKVIKKLKKKKKYYIQVRGYIKESGTTVYGKWSPKRSARTK